MPVAVQDALREVAIEEGGLTEDQGAEFMRMLETSKRLQLETWS